VDTKDFWKPIITPYELELALQSDDTRVWTGAWRGDYQAILDANPVSPDASQELHETQSGAPDNGREDDGQDDTSDFESAPPEFNLRTGQFVTNSRPMQHLTNGASRRAANTLSNGTALAKRAKGDVATIGSTVSPGAEFLRSQRTWQGLGSDFEIKYEEDGEPGGTAVVEGRKGIARGYTVGSSADRR
jgi:diphthamide biosynthesis protein 2